MKTKLTITKLEQAVSLREQILALEQRLATLFGGKRATRTTIKKGRRKKKSRGRPSKKRVVAVIPADESSQRR